MTRKRQLRFTIIRGLVAILIALLVATVLIFISAEGRTFMDKLQATGEALKQMLLGPIFRFSKKAGLSFEAKRLLDIFAAMIPIIFTGLSVCVMFSANQFNLGAEGGIMLGAFVAAMVNDPLFIGAKLTWGFPLALIAVLLCGLFMYRSRWGYSIRMIGINQEFARYSGMNVGKTIVLSQLIGGFLAGAGGGIEMLGRYETFSWNALPGYGWTGITIAILAGNNPYMVPLAAFFMAYLSKGCDLMATYARVPAQLINIIQGVIFLFFAADRFLSKYRQKLVVKSAEEELARAGALKED